MRHSEMTGEELKRARQALGLTIGDFADLMNLADIRPVRRWELGSKGGQGRTEIPGPIIVLVRALLASPAVRDYFRVKLNEPRGE